MLTQRIGQTLPAAPALRTRLLLPLVLAPEQPLRQRRSRGAKLREFGLQPRTAGLRPAERTAQPSVLPRQRPERRLLAPRPPQGLAEFRVPTRRHRARRILRAQQPLLQPLLHSTSGPEGDTQFPQLPVEPDELLLAATWGIYRFTGWEFLVSGMSVASGLGTAAAALRRTTRRIGRDAPPMVPAPSTASAGHRLELGMDGLPVTDIARI